MSNGVRYHDHFSFNSRTSAVLSKPAEERHKLPDIKSVLLSSVDCNQYGSCNFNEEDDTSPSYFIGENPLQIDLDARADEDGIDPRSTPHHPYRHRKIIINHSSDSESVRFGSPYSQYAESQSSDDVFRFEPNSNYNSPAGSESPLNLSIRKPQTEQRDDGNLTEERNVPDYSSCEGLEEDVEENIYHADESMLVLTEEDGGGISISDVISLANRCIPGDHLSVIACEVEVEGSKSPTVPTCKNSKPSQEDSGCDLSGKERGTLSNGRSSSVSSQSDGFSGVLSEGSIEDDILGLTVQDENVLVNNAAELLTQLVVPNEIDIKRVQRCIAESRDRESAEQSFDDLMSYHLAGKAVEEYISKMHSKNIGTQVDSDDEEVGNDIKSGTEDAIKQTAILNGDLSLTQNRCVGNKRSATPEKKDTRSVFDFSEDENDMCQKSVFTITPIKSTTTSCISSIEKRNLGIVPLDKVCKLANRSKSYTSSEEREFSHMSGEGTIADEGSSSRTRELSKSRKNIDFKRKNSPGRRLAEINHLDKIENAVNDCSEDSDNRMEYDSSPNDSNETQVFGNPENVTDYNETPNHTTPTNAGEIESCIRHTSIPSDTGKGVQRIDTESIDGSGGHDQNDESHDSLDTTEDDSFSVAYTNAADDLSPIETDSRDDMDSDFNPPTASGEDEEMDTDTNISDAEDDDGEEEENPIGEEQNSSESIKHDDVADDDSIEGASQTASTDSLEYSDVGSEETVCDGKSVVPEFKEECTDGHCHDNETKSPISNDNDESKDDDDGVIIVDETPPIAAVKKKLQKRRSVRSRQRRNTFSNPVSPESDLSAADDIQVKGDIIQSRRKECKVVLEKLDLSKEDGESRNLSSVPSASTPHKDSGQYECYICGKNFHTKAARRLHHMAHSNHIKFKCRYCSKSFPKKTLLPHVRNHLLQGSQKRYSCSYCGQAFHYIYRVQKHIRDVHPVNPEKASKRDFQCEECGRSFSSRQGIAMHKVHGHKGYELKNSEHGDRPKVNKEGIEVIENTKEIRQSSSVPQQKDFRCQECDKTFKMKSHLTLHMKRHAKKKTHTVRNQSRSKKKVESNLNTKSHGNLSATLAGRTRGHQAGGQRSKIRGTSQQSTVNQFMCWICHASYINQIGLNNHVVQSHLIRAGGACHICGQKWHSVVQVLEHSNYHTARVKRKNPFVITKRERILKKKEEILTDQPEDKRGRGTGEKRRSELSREGSQVGRCSASEDSRKSADFEATDRSARDPTPEEEDNQDEVESRWGNSNEDAFYDPTEASLVSDDESRTGISMGDNPNTSSAMGHTHEANQKVAQTEHKECENRTTEEANFDQSRHGNVDSSSATGYITKANKKVAQNQNEKGKNRTAEVEVVDQARLRNGDSSSATGHIPKANKKVAQNQHEESQNRTTEEANFDQARHGNVDSSSATGHIPKANTKVAQNHHEVGQNRTTEEANFDQARHGNVDSSSATGHIPKANKKVAQTQHEETQNQTTGEANFDQARQNVDSSSATGHIPKATQKVAQNPHEEGENRTAKVVDSDQLKQGNRDSSSATGHIPKANKKVAQTQHEETQNQTTGEANFDQARHGNVDTSSATGHIPKAIQKVAQNPHEEGENRTAKVMDSDQLKQGNRDSSSATGQIPEANKKVAQTQHEESQNRRTEEANFYLARQGNGDSSSATGHIPKANQKVAQNPHMEGENRTAEVADSDQAIQGNVDSAILETQKIKQKKLRKCKKCGAVFQRGTSLIQHMRLHLIEKRHRCPKCGETFRKKSTLANHMTSHTPKKRHCCSVCNKSFKSKIKLLKHKLNHKGKTPQKSPSKRDIKMLQSPKRDKSFTSPNKVSMKQNYKVETPASSNQLRKKLYWCNECNEVFRTSVKLLNHKRSHEDRNFLCKQCGESFHKIGELDEHFNAEHGTKRVKLGAKRSSDLKCCVCNMPFIELQSLIIHMTTHLQPASLK